MNKLKTKLSSVECSLEDLKSVAHDLVSFYKITPMSKPEGLSPEKIHEELTLISDDPDFTHGTREVRLDELKNELLSIINSIIQNTKANNNSNTEPKRNVLIRVRDNSLEIIFELFKIIKITIRGISKLGMRYALFFGLIVLGLAVLYVTIVANHKQEETKGDYKVIAETLIKDYESRKLSFERKRDSLNNIINHGLIGNLQRKKAVLLTLREVEREIDLMRAVILPDLELIKSKEIDSAGRSKIDSYKQNLQNPEK